MKCSAGNQVFGTYENNAGYFLLFFRHERFDIEKMAVFSSLVWFPPETTGGGGVDRKCFRRQMNILYIYEYSTFTSDSVVFFNNFLWCSSIDAIGRKWESPPLIPLTHHVHETDGNAITAFQTPSRLRWLGSGLVYGLVRSFPAHTRVTKEYSHSWNQMSLSSDKKLRSRHPWVKLAPPRTATCRLSYPRARSDALAAAPSSHSCSEALRYIQETQTRYIFAGLT